MKSLLSLALALAAGAHALEEVPVKQDNRPNIVLILTDDQDLHMQSIDYMPLLKKHISDHGTVYRRHYCTTAICCPSRVTLWTGRNAHNTNVTDVVAPYGGYPKFISEGWNENWLPVWLQAAGYSTYYTGKLFNALSLDNWNSPHPAGWTSSDFLLDPNTYAYLNATFQRNEEEPVNYPGEYSTDLLTQKAYGLLQEGVDSNKPFFLAASPIAPHSNVNTNYFLRGADAPAEKQYMTAPIPADRHKNLFLNATVPRTANFNPDQAGGASWIKQLAKLTPDVVAYNDEYYRARLQSLQAVDELVEGLVSRLSDYGILDNTYVIYSSDNGFHISQHRLNPGKDCGFEEDINIPLIIRGPGVPVGEASIVTAHTDLAPTILKLAESQVGWEGLDGTPIPLDEDAFREAKHSRQEHVNVEFWGTSLAEGIHGFSLDDGKVVSYGSNNTYKALRLISERYEFYYTVWCTNEHELYEMKSDPGQINNLYPSMLAPYNYNTTLLNLPLSTILPRLDALLMVTKSCKASTCVEPWSFIHPAGNVKTLGDALNPKYDEFYASIAEKVGFNKCELGYILSSEGPQQSIVYEEGAQY